MARSKSDGEPISKLNRRHSDLCRTKIKCTQLIKLLQDFALGVGKKDLTDKQIDSAKFLISYSISKPATEQSVTMDGTVTVEVVRFASADS